MAGHKTYVLIINHTTKEYSFIDREFTDLIKSTLFLWVLHFGHQTESFRIDGLRALIDKEFRLMELEYRQYLNR